MQEEHEVSAGVSKTAIFVHIPRTAGTTLHRIIDRHFTASTLFTLGPNAQAGIETFNALPEATRGRYLMIKGHLPFGKPENVIGAPSWFTVLREPLARSVSFYRYVREHPEHYLHDPLSPQDSMLEFLRVKKPKMMDNAQVRMLSGAWLDPPYGECTQELLDIALQNLRTRMLVVGLTEKFDETLLLLRRHFGWQWLNYERLNASVADLADAPLSREEQHVLEQHNALDSELYRSACDIHMKHTAQYGEDFERDLADFRQRNRPYPALLETYWRLRSRGIWRSVKTLLNRAT